MKPELSSSLEDCINLTIPKRDFNSFFNYLVGSKETEELVFPRPIMVTIEDLTELNKEITQKFATVDTIALNSTVFVSYTNLTRQEFGSFDEFKQTDFQTTEVTLEVIIKYDALIKLKESPSPQRHILTVKIFTTPDISQIIKTVINTDMMTEARIDHMLGPVVCRVEYVNRLVGKELSNIVREWTNSRKLSFFEKKWIGWLKGHSNVLPTTLRFVTLIISLAIFLALTIGYFNESSQTKKEVLTVGDVEFLIFVISGFVLLLSTLWELNKFFRRSAEKLLKMYSLNSIVFHLTSGDTNFERQSILQNNKTIRLWIFTFVYNIIINILAGLFVFQILNAF